MNVLAVIDNFLPAYPSSSSLVSSARNGTRRDMSSLHNKQNVSAEDGENFPQGHTAGRVLFSLRKTGLHATRKPSEKTELHDVDEVDVSDDPFL